MNKCLQEAAELDAERRNRLDAILYNIAELWPAAWLKVARFRRSINLPRKDIAYALRRAVEEQPFNKDAWLDRAGFAREEGDEMSFIAAMLSAVDADPSDVDLIREAAFELCKYVDAHKYEIAKARRGVYLASVRSHMVRIADQLDPTGLSRLAWLFLLEDDQASAWQYANMGLAADATNRHCLNIAQKLDNHGYRT